MLNPPRPLPVPHPAAGPAATEGGKPQILVEEWEPGAPPSAAPYCFAPSFWLAIDRPPHPCPRPSPWPKASAPGPASLQRIQVRQVKLRHRRRNRLRRLRNQSVINIDRLLIPRRPVIQPASASFAKLARFRPRPRALSAPSPPFRSGPVPRPSPGKVVRLVPPAASHTPAPPPQTFRTRPLTARSPSRTPRSPAVPRQRQLRRVNVHRRAQRHIRRRRALVPKSQAAANTSTPPPRSRPKPAIRNGARSAS